MMGRMEIMRRGMRYVWDRQTGIHWKYTVASSFVCACMCTLGCVGVGY